MRSQVHIPSRRAERKLIIELYLPDTYPSRCAPGVKVIAPHLDGELQSWVLRELKELFQPGARDYHMAAYTEPGLVDVAKQPHVTSVLGITQNFKRIPWFI